MENTGKADASAIVILLDDVPLGGTYNQGFRITPDTVPKAIRAGEYKEYLPQISHSTLKLDITWIDPSGGGEYHGTIPLSP